MSFITFSFSQMPLTFIKIKKKVKQDILFSILKKMISLCSFPNKTLWYSKQLSFFKEKMILIMLYKDLTGIGYNGLQKDVSKWIKISLESL
jgi:glycyl-tRNA synthetase beta subunit